MLFVRIRCILAVHVLPITPCVCCACLSWFFLLQYMESRRRHAYTHFVCCWSFRRFFAVEMSPCTLLVRFCYRFVWTAIQSSLKEHLLEQSSPSFACSLVTSVGCCWHVFFLFLVMLRLMLDAAVSYSRWRGTWLPKTWSRWPIYVQNLVVVQGLQENVIFYQPLHGIIKKKKSSAGNILKIYVCYASSPELSLL